MSWQGTSRNTKRRRPHGNALAQSEEYVLLAGITHDGRPLDTEAIKRLFTLDGTVVHESPAAMNAGVSTILDKNEREVIAGVSQRNINYFENEAEKLDGWAEDLKHGLEREIKDIDKQIKETRRLSVAALTLDEKLKRQREIKSLESARNTKRKSSLTPKTTSTAAVTRSSKILKQN